MANRPDSLGFFWQDHAKVKAPPKEVIKRTPPERTWELANYLPGLEEALVFKPDLLTDYELGQAVFNKDRFVFDIECYPNYTLLMFRSIVSKKTVHFIQSELWLGTEAIDIPKLTYCLMNLCIVNFNGRAYDFVIAALALAGYDSEAMWTATSMLIEQGLRDKEVLKYFKCQPLKGHNQIDLIELTAGGPGLKVCAGRLHAPKMQDLPFVPGTYLTTDQAAIVFMYCFNDLDNTELLYWSVLPQIEVREATGQKYYLDLRSHSDAQMAEAIISSELKRITGAKHIARSKVENGAVHKFKVPQFISYRTPLLNNALDLIRNANFVIDENGKVVMPAELSNLTIAMNKSVYQMGIGGLHSQESSVAHVSDDQYVIIDTDATSYYPKLILNAGLMPKNLGHNFLVVYNGIVVDRVNAKRAGDIIVAECLKIVVNGTFGKLGSMWSIVYSPDLMIQVTLTGQLSMLMLAESLELNNFEVTSINTDGIVTKVLRNREHEFHAIVQAWEKTTGFETEETRYAATYSRDINSYIAIYEIPQKGKRFKAKGPYGPTAPKKNAINEICVDAITAKILDGTDLMTTIKSCTKVSMFTSMRAVAGGAVKDGEYLGKVIRWYYSTEAQGEIIYAKNGNKVPRTDNAKPLMNLPLSLPTDIDYDWYFKECESILKDIGYS